MAKEGNDNILKIEEGTEVITIGQFCGNEGLASVSLPASLHKIEDYAFANCRNLTTIDLPDGLKEIGEFAFMGCERLANISIPDTVKTIGKGAFADCTALQTIEFPKSYKELSPEMVKGCHILKEIRLGDSFATKDGCIIDSATGGLVLVLPYAVVGKTLCLPHSISIINPAALSLCKNVEKIAIPKELDEIDGSTFAGLDNLKEIEIEVGSKLQFADGLLTKNGVVLFHIPHSGQKELHIPARIKGIGNSAFTHCDGLESIVVERSEAGTVFEIMDSAFRECNNLKKIKVCGPAKIGNQAFLDCENLEDADFAEVVSIGDLAFAHCTKLRNAPLSDATTHIGEDAFADCVALKKISIPTETKEISPGTFADCTSLEEVDFHDDIEVIGNQAFLGCAKLKNIDLPQNLKEIGYGAFAWCGLQSVAIPRKVERIDDFAFAMCKNIEAATMPSSFFDRTSQIFAGDNKLQMMGSNDEVK